MGLITPSNGTNLTIAEEVLGSPGVLPGTPVWNPLEPNSYGEFGSQIKLTPRAPINQSRQRRKGNVTDLDAAGAFSTDFTSRSLSSILPGFMFADWRHKDSYPPSAVTATDYTVAGAAVFPAGTLVYASNFALSSNNGLKLVGAGSTATAIKAPGLAAEAAPPTGAVVHRVGFQAAAGDLVLTVVSGQVVLTTTALSFGDYGLIPGEWLWVGGDDALTQFATVGANGFYRIQSVAAKAITFDRWPTTALPDAGTAKTVQVYFGSVIKNESDPNLIKLRTYQLERRLSSAGFEYLKGAASSTMAIQIKKADKVTIDFSYVGLDSETLPAQKSGARPALVKQSMFNSSSDFSRLRFLNDTDGVSLASYVDEITLSIDNGIDPVKAVGALGGIDINYGDFMVAGNINAFFTSVAAVQAVRNNADVALDFAMVTRSNGRPVGWLFDVPLIALGDARIKVEKDKPVMLPVTLDAAAHDKLDHTLLVVHYTYLPALAL